MSVPKYSEHPKICLGLGYLSAWLTGLSLPVCIAVGIYLNVYLRNATGTPTLVWLDGELKLKYLLEVQTIAGANLILFVLLIVMTFSFVFSFGLIDGIKKRDAKSVKGYVNFGFFLIGSCTTYMIIKIREQDGSGPLYAYSIICFLWVIYCPTLFFVYETYKSYETSGADSSANKPCKQAEV